jgi:hypothetical protein
MVGCRHRPTSEPRGAPPGPAHWAGRLAPKTGRPPSRPWTVRWPRAAFLVAAAAAAAAELVWKDSSAEWAGRTRRVLTVHWQAGEGEGKLRAGGGVGGRRVEQAEVGRRRTW